MVQTIINAIKLNKTPNAYLLTGIRGVGKTTTARLIAKALNCEKNFNPKLNCTSEKFCETCQKSLIQITLIFWRWMQHQKQELMMLEN